MTYEQLKKQRSRLYEDFAMRVLDLSNRGRLDAENIELIRRLATETSDEIRAIQNQIDDHLDRIWDRANENLK